MNGYWEELIGKVEELLHATDHPDNYRMHIQYIIQFSSDGLQRLKSFLRLHVRRCACTAGCHRMRVAVHQPLLTSKQGMVDIQVDKSLSNC